LEIRLAKDMTRWQPGYMGSQKTVEELAALKRTVLPGWSFILAVPYLLIAGLIAAPIGEVRGEPIRDINQVVVILTKTGELLAGNFFWLLSVAAACLVVLAFARPEDAQSRSTFNSLKLRISYVEPPIVAAGLLVMLWAFSESTPTALAYCLSIGVLLAVVMTLTRFMIQQVPLDRDEEIAWRRKEIARLGSWQQQLRPVKSLTRAAGNVLLCLSFGAAFVWLVALFIVGPSLAFLFQAGLICGLGTIAAFFRARAYATEYRVVHVLYGGLLDLYFLMLAIAFTVVAPARELSTGVILWAMCGVIVMTWFTSVRRVQPPWVSQWTLVGAAHYFADRQVRRRIDALKDELMALQPIDTPRHNMRLVKLLAKLALAMRPSRD